MCCMRRDACGGRGPTAVRALTDMGVAAGSNRDFPPDQVHSTAAMLLFSYLQLTFSAASR